MFFFINFSHDTHTVMRTFERFLFFFFFSDSDYTISSPRIWFNIWNIWHRAYAEEFLVRGNFSKGRELVLKIWYFVCTRFFVSSILIIFFFFVENRRIMWNFFQVFFSHYGPRNENGIRSSSLRNIMQMPYLRKQMVKLTVKLRRIHVSWKKIRLQQGFM